MTMMLSGTGKDPIPRAQADNGHMPMGAAERGGPEDHLHRRSRDTMAGIQDPQGITQVLRWFLTYWPQPLEWSSR